MAFIYKNYGYPGASRIIEHRGRHFLCAPGISIELHDPSAVIEVPEPRVRTWAQLPYVDDEEAAVAESAASARDIVDDEEAAEEQRRSTRRALRKLAASKVSTYTLDRLNELEARAGLEDVVTGDGQMLKKDRHRLLKRAAKAALKDMGE